MKRHRGCAKRRISTIDISLIFEKMSTEQHEAGQCKTGAGDLSPDYDAYRIRQGVEKKDGSFAEEKVRRIRS